MQDIKIEATDAIMFYPTSHGNDAFAVHYTEAIDKPYGWDAKPLSEANLKELCQGVAQEPQILPANMLWYEDQQQMIWYSPPRRHRLTYGHKDKPSVMQYNHPGLVFRVKRSDHGQDRLYVVAVGTPYDRGNWFTPILESPYDRHSVGHNGSVGTCGVKLPKDEWAYDLSIGIHREWELCFYNSKFSRKPKRRNHLKPLTTWGKHSSKPTTTTLIDWMQYNERD